MIVFNGHHVSNLNIEKYVKNDDIVKIIAALLILEHGTTQSIAPGRPIRIRSDIFVKRGYGNVVLGVVKRPATFKANIITPVPRWIHTEAVDKATSDFERRHDVDLDSPILWTGSKGFNSKMYVYARFQNFGDYVDYILRRLKLNADTGATLGLNSQLASYSGNSPGYASKVRSIAGKIKIINA